MRKELNKYWILICAVCFANVASAQISFGTEFIVNTTTVNQQRNPAIGSDSVGNSIVVWESMENAADQYGIFAQRFNNMGAPLGAEYRINNVNANAQRFPDVAVNKNGQTVIVWQSKYQDGSFNGIYRKVYDNAGTAVSSESRVNTTTLGNQIRPKIAMAANGDFVIVWMSENQDGDGYGIYGRRYAASGAALSTEFLINDSTTGYQGYPDIALKPNGDFIVCWQSYGTDGSGSGIYAKRFDASGTAIGGQFLVNTTTAGNQQEPAVAYKPTGDFGIVWSSYNQDGNEYGIYGKLYNNLGAVISPEFLVNDSTAGNQGHASMVSSPGGRYFISWTNDIIDNNRGGTFFTSIANNGMKTPTYQVNNRVQDYQQFSAITTWSDTSVQVVFQDGLEWDMSTHDGDRYGIYSRVANLPTPNFDTLNPSTCDTAYTSPSGKVWAVTGTYYDTLFSVENYDSVYYTINLTVNSLPVVIVNTVPNDTLCLGDSLVLYGSGASSYAWTGGVTDSATFVPLASTNYIVTGTDSNGCVNTDTIDIVVHSLPIITASASPSDTICGADSLTLNGMGASSYSWSGGVTNNMIFATPPTGINTTLLYTVTGIDANGCSNTNSISIYSMEQPNVIVSQPAVTLCSGSSDLLLASGATSYIWMPGSVMNDSLLLPANTVSGTYTVTGTAGNGCSKSASLSVTVNTPSGNLAQATASNANSTAGTQTNNVHQPNDGLLYSYYDPSCNIIASIQEAAGDSSLGMVASTVTVDATVPTYNGQPYVARWFDIVPENQGPATVTLYFTDDDFIDYNASSGVFPTIPTNAGLATVATNLAITKTNGPLGSGTPTVINVVANWNATEARWEVTFPVTGFSQFRLHSQNPGGAALAIDLKSFTVTKERTSDLAKWQTLSETNSSHFIVERSADGITFEALGKVVTKATNGNSTEELDYAFVDQLPLIGHNYYRLQHADINGNLSYSKIVDVVWRGDQVVKMYPNPTNDLINIDFNLAELSQIEIKIIDMSGRVVKSILSNSVKGMNHKEINLNELANGIYHVQLLENSKNIYQGKIIKE